MTRKAAHVFEYFVLGLLLFRVFHVPGAGWKWRCCLFAVLGVVLWALGDEFHQSFVATRTSSITDVGIDATGGILSQIVSAIWIVRK
jgi:VanZ family protein